VPDVNGVFAANLRRLRAERGWTHARLAREAGVSASVLSLIETRRQPGTTIFVADAVARALGTTAGAMLTEGADGG
jgi:transcriptional regulator with XRE-family HTH domain